MLFPRLYSTFKPAKKFEPSFDIKQDYEQNRKISHGQAYTEIGFQAKGADLYAGRLPDYSPLLLAPWILHRDPAQPKHLANNPSLNRIPLLVGDSRVKNRRVEVLHKSTSSAAAEGMLNVAFANSGQTVSVKLADPNAVMASSGGDPDDRAADPDCEFGMPVPGQVGVRPHAGGGYVHPFFLQLLIHEEVYLVGPDRSQVVVGDEGGGPGPGREIAPENECVGHIFRHEQSAPYDLPDGPEDRMARIVRTPTRPCVSPRRDQHIAPDETKTPRPLLEKIPRRSCTWHDPPLHPRSCTWHDPPQILARPPSTPDPGTTPPSTPDPAPGTTPQILHPARTPWHDPPGTTPPGSYTPPDAINPGLPDHSSKNPRSCTWTWSPAAN